MRFLIRDRDGKFCRPFDEVFRSEGAEVLVTPLQAPNANACAERWIRTVRAECLDWLLVVGRQHLARVLRVYVDHYNRYRPYRALGLRPPNLPALCSSPAGISTAAYTDATCSAGSSTSTNELHERIYTPYGLPTGPTGRTRP